MAITIDFGDRVTVEEIAFMDPPIMEDLLLVDLTGFLDEERERANREIESPGLRCNCEDYPCYGH
jgi:hypothetical protein